MMHPALAAASTPPNPATSSPSKLTPSSPSAGFEKLAYAPVCTPAEAGSDTAPASMAARMSEF